MGRMRDPPDSDDFVVDEKLIVDNKSTENLPAATPT
jgi:hypothetical protein